ncbi:BCNT-domain-containing protein [Xylona heveae TC161]|uniref:SWR1-complex protein 5 n=1 Tax=Xylona heveae (strain CBS 132557 / TC161) TaxID=1328760 RepID=A0A165HWX4_XYLHT|nr:BCNT-domain-containing protein [Xylona heveae TC161]KZF24040.1 BCNT-domain-containing protein [Xylona heveae TC161]
MAATEDATARTEIPVGNEEEYISSEDEDYNPEAVNGEADGGEESESSSEDEQAPGAGKKPSRPKKRKSGPTENDEQAEELDSGDEATIRKGAKRRKQRKAGGKDQDDEEDDEGGEGGLIKTRAQRAAEKQEKGPLASTDGATVDVDALWKSMISGPPTNKPDPEAQSKPEQTPAQQDQASFADTTKSLTNGHSTTTTPSTKTTTTATTTTKAPDEETILIKRTYKFAGEIITEEKRVPKSSAEARLYLQSLESSSSSSSPATSQQQQQQQNRPPPLRRPKKRTSLFDPGTTAPTTINGGTNAGVAPGAGAGAGAGARGVPHKTAAGPKLNTVEKSKLDWAGFVDKEGIAEELDEHSRAKEGYLGRMEFLGRVDAKKEDELRAARRK